MFIKGPPNCIMTNKHVLWIGIDPNILLEGLDTATLFKCENYLKFSINSGVDKEIVEEDTHNANSEDNCSQS